MAIRAHDHDAMPMCNDCHRDFHDARGKFKTWTKVEKRDWQDEQISIHRERFLRKGDMIW